MTAPRRVLIAVHEASRTGAVLHALDVLTLLGDARSERVVALRRPGPMQDELAHNSERMVRIPWSAVDRTATKLRWWGVRPPHPRGRAPWRLRRLLVDVDPDLVYAETAVNADVAAAAAEAGFPVVLSLHERPQVLQRFRSATGAEGLATIVVNSRTTEAAVRAIHPGADVRVVPSPVDVDQVRERARHAWPDELDFLRGRRFVVGAGRVSHNKGVDVLVEAAARMRSSLEPVHVLWLGRGPDEGKLRRRLGRSGVAERFHFRAPLEEPHPVLAAAACVVIPSRYESLSRLALEALALGRPVVASAVGGLPEAVDDFATLVPPDDPAALAAALDGVLSSPPAIDASAVERHLASFSCGAFREGLSGVFAAVLGDRDPGPGWPITR